MENSISALAQIKNSEAVQKAIAHYTQQMDQKVMFPTESHAELLDLHRASEKEALEVFLKNSFNDEDQNFKKELEMQLQAKLDDFNKQNLEASSDHCSALIQSLFGPLENNVKQGIYSKSGGHCLFIQKPEELKAKYYHEPMKRVQAEEVLQKYLQSQKAKSDAILQTDQALTAKQKWLDARKRAAVAQKLANQKRIEEMQRAQEEHMRQLEMIRAQEERKWAQQLKEQRRNIKCTLQEAAEKEKRRLYEERINFQIRLKNSTEIFSPAVIVAYYNNYLHITTLWSFFVPVH